MGWTVYNSDGQILQGSATLANDSVDSQHYAADSIDNEHLANDAVGVDELAANAVVNDSIASGAAVEFSKMENLTTGRLLVSDGSGDVSVSAVTAAEILQLNGLSANVTDTNLNALTAGSGNTTLHSHAGGGGAVTRAGGNLTESTTTTTSAADIHSTTSLSIGTSTGFDAVLGTRKTSGATAGFGAGVKINTTITSEAHATGGHVFLPTNHQTNAAENRWGHLDSGIRISNYAHGINSTGSGFTNTAQTAGGRPQSQADMPVATLTSIIVRGFCSSSSITGGVDEMHVYTRAIS